MDTILLLAQLVSTGLLAAWLSTGVYDNLRHPDMNRAAIAEVMAMRRMREAYPEDFASVATRAVTNAHWHRQVFRLVVFAELIATGLLWLGVITLFGAMLGWGPRESATALAMLGGLAFTTIWAGFLIVGNYFCYWYCHEGAQNTHYQMTLWGTATLILLAQ